MLCSKLFFLEGVSALSYVRPYNETNTPPGIDRRYNPVLGPYYNITLNVTFSPLEQIIAKKYVQNNTITMSDLAKVWIKATNLPQHCWAAMLIPIGENNVFCRDNKTVPFSGSCPVVVGNTTSGNVSMPSSEDPDLFAYQVDSGTGGLYQVQEEPVDPNCGLDAEDPYCAVRNAVVHAQEVTYGFKYADMDVYDRDKTLSYDKHGQPFIPTDLAYASMANETKTSLEIVKSNLYDNRTGRYGGLGNLFPFWTNATEAQEDCKNGNGALLQGYLGPFGMWGDRAKSYLYNSGKPVSPTSEDSSGCHQGHFTPKCGNGLVSGWGGDLVQYCRRQDPIGFVGPRERLTVGKLPHLDDMTNTNKWYNEYHAADMLKMARTACENAKKELQEPPVMSP